jgi:16S rRNA (cytosine1402-N4)-methyltransferase
MEFKHKSVLLTESVDALQIKENGIYVDATAGGGGHSAEMLKRLKSGRLIAIDRDPDAIAVLTERFKDDSKVTIVNNNFSEIKAVLAELNIDGVDGILADLGVSSFQLDTDERGFSFHKDAPLDMRMDKSGLSARDVVNTYSEKELAQVIFRYGEEKFAKSIAANIVRARAKKPIETTAELAEIIKISIPARARREGGHPARRTFQAIRIEVNGELELLPGAIEDMFSVLNENGVLAIITFHSLEDRIVKQKFSEFCKGCECPKDFPVCVCGKTPRGELPFKSVEPGEEETEENNRSRSARLRSVRKLPIK